MEKPITYIGLDKHKETITAGSILARLGQSRSILTD